MDNELEDLKKILDEDEEIKECFKPNRKRFVVLRSISMSLFLFIFGAIFLTVGILSAINIIKITEEVESGPEMIVAPIIFIIFGSLPFIIAILNIFGNAVRYKRTIYVVTNKRLIIRSGFVGVDYKAIELKNVGLVNVRVDFFDKLVKPATGTVFFGSSSMPVGGNNSAALFTFACVDDPYEVYKKVKSYIK